MATLEEQRIIGDIKELLTNSDNLPTAETIQEQILSAFNQNSQAILKNDATPFYLLLKAISEITELNAQQMASALGNMLYTHAQGDMLSIVSSNFGKTRIEAKPSTITALITVNKDVTITEGTVFIDGYDTNWVAKADSNITKEQGSGRVYLESSEEGAVTFVTPLKAENTISGVTNIEAIYNTLVVGRAQETDAELKTRIAKGVTIKESSEDCRIALLNLKYINSAFVYTNSEPTRQIFNGIPIDPHYRFVAVRFSSTAVLESEVNEVARTIMDNGAFQANTQKPENIGYFFGIEKDNLPKPIEEGGANIAFKAGSPNVLVRITMEWGNYRDIYFRLAQSTKIELLVVISYRTSYTDIEKISLNSTLRELYALAIAESASVGGTLETSTISQKVQNNVANITSKVVVREVYLRKYGEEKGRDKVQYLQADAFEFFELFSTESEPYNGIKIVEYGDPVSMKELE